MDLGTKSGQDPRIAGGLARTPFKTSNCTPNTGKTGQYLRHDSSLSPFSLVSSESYHGPARQAKLKDSTLANWRRANHPACGRDTVQVSQASPSPCASCRGLRLLFTRLFFSSCLPIEPPPPLPLAPSCPARSCTTSIHHRLPSDDTNLALVSTDHRGGSSNSLQHCRSH